MRQLPAVLLALAACALPAHAEMQLIPSPYPSGNDSARILVAPPVSRHQYMVPTPYPRSLGPNALGDPRPTRVRRHQHPVPAPYPRQYR